MNDAARVQAYLRAAAATAGESPTAGGFQLKIRTDAPGVGANYAMPLAPTGFDLEALWEAFAAHDRTPRLEWVAEYAPGLEAAVVAAGLELVLRSPVMTCAASDRREPPPVPGLVIVEVAADAPAAVIRELVEVQEEGFGVAEIDVGDDDVAYMRRVLGGAALGRLDGEPAGAAALRALRGGMSEIVGVATRPGFRRRGVAAALVGAVARQGFALGAELLLLTPGDAGAQRLYARAGFVPGLTMLHYRAPAA